MYAVHHCKQTKNYYSIKQKSSESLNEYKDRLTAAVERIRSADPDQVPLAADQARKFTTSLDSRRFNRLIMDCELDETKYEETLAAALQQASVVSDQMIHTGGNMLEPQSVTTESSSCLEKSVKWS